MFLEDTVSLWKQAKVTCNLQEEKFGTEKPKSIWEKLDLSDVSHDIKGYELKDMFFEG
ncbi:hypothetical protein [Atrimonas thermophila]|uniref:hypothetical protein n=1 Tax=Atrimonas thermophila TaxID=3064161 RepID=UPI00399D32F5